MEQTQVTISIGKQERTYGLYETNAPAAYDYGGVLEIYDGGGTRLLLVPANQADYQAGRNASGSYTFKASDDIPESAIADDLWNKVTAYDKRSERTA